MESLSKWIISANFLWLTTSFGQNLQKVSANPQPRSESLICREERPRDPEADLRRKLCGLSVHMVTGVCRISNPIQPASLFSITISVKKKGAVHTRRSKVED